MTKKILAITLILCLVCTLLSSCTDKENAVCLTVGNTAVDSEMFTYYLDKAYSENLTQDARISQAISDCVRYVALGSMLTEYGLSMSDDEISTASEEASFLWNMFGKYYRSEGVSKSTFVKIHIASKYTEKLRTAIYGKDGTEEIEDAYLRGALKEFFVAYKTITVPLHSKNVYGNDEDFTQEETDQLRHVISDSTQKINNGENLESVAAAIAVDYPLTEYSGEVTVYGPSRHDITQEFIDAVKAMDENTAGSIEMDGTVYIVYRVDILSDTQILEDNREECLEILSDTPLENLIQTACNSYSPVKNSSAISDCEKAVKKAKLG